MRPRREWKLRELRLIQAYYGRLRTEDIAWLLDRCRGVVYRAAREMGLAPCRTKWTMEAMDLVRQHYGKMPTPALAQLCGKSVSSTYQAAQRLGIRLVSWFPPSVRDAVRRLHAEGLPDRLIAAKLGMKRDSVKEMRRLRLKLPCNPDIEGKRQAVRTQWARLGIKSAGELRARVLKNRVVQSGWPEDLQWREAQVMNVLAERGPLTRLELAKAIGMRTDRCDRPGHLALLTGNRRGGTLTASLMQRGLVVPLGRRYDPQRPHRWEMVYSIALAAHRRLPDERSA